jgi:hypothetical protein
VPAAKSIWRAHAVELDALGLEGLSHKVCWGCRFATTPERAHIVARSAGGSSEPDNFVLLCHLCHKSQPDGMASLSALARWLKGRPKAAARHTEARLEALSEMMGRVRAEVGEQRWAAWLATEPDGLELLGYAQSISARCNVETVFANLETSMLDAINAVH